MERRYTYNGYGQIAEYQYDILADLMPQAETGSDVGMALFEADLADAWESERMEGMTVGQAWQWFSSGQSVLDRIAR